MAAGQGDARRIGIYGRSGSGKSTLSKRMLAGHKRLVVFDTQDEYRSFGFRRYSTLRGVLGAMQRGWKDGFRVAYVPPNGNEPMALHMLSLLLRRVQGPYKAGASKVKLALVVEELNMSFPVNALPRELSGFGELCSRGRHYGIEIFGITQRIAEVNTRWRGNTNAAYIFPQGDHVDINTITRMIGPRWREKLLNLPDHQYLKIESGAVTEGKNPPWKNK